jgi:1,4-alpha-glucan branching enzyme
MWAHPGKQLVFMGGEFGQEREWSNERELDWYLLDDPGYAGIQRVVTDLTRTYKQTPALWQMDSNPDGFAWIDAGNADQNVISFFRRAADGRPGLACVANLAAETRENFRVGLPLAGTWEELLNTDAAVYGGSNVGNLGVASAEAEPWNGQPCSAVLTLPALAVLWLRPAPPRSKRSARRAAGR